MFIAPISFSFAQNRQQNAAKYSNLPRLKALEADTVSFTANYTKAVHHAAQKLHSGASEKVINPMDAVLSQNGKTGTNIADIVGSVADSAKEVLKVDKLNEQFKVMLASLIYEPEGKLMVALPSNKNELVALIGRGYHGPAEKAKTFAQSVQILNGENAIGYTGYKPSPANTVEELVDDIGILGLREAILPYIETLNKGRSAYSAEELDQRLNEILHQNYNDNIINAEIIDYFFKLTDKEVPGNIENAFFKRMQSSNINPNGDLSTNEIINIIESFRGVVDRDPYMVEKFLGNGIQRKQKTNKKNPVDLIDEIERKLEKDRAKAEAEAKAAEAKAARKKAKAKNVKPDKVKPAAKQKPVTQMSKSEAEIAIEAKYSKYLLEHINIYRVPEQQKRGQEKAEELINQEFAPAFAKYANLKDTFKKKIVGKIEDVFNHKAKLINLVPVALDERLVEMANGVVEMNTYRANITALEEKLAKNGTKNKAKLRAELKENQDKLEETKSIWSDYLHDVVKDENINREDCIARSIGSEYDYFTATNKELNALKKWEAARQENGGVVSEDTWAEITKFYGEYINPLYAKKEPSIHVTKFAFNR